MKYIAQSKGDSSVFMTEDTAFFLVALYNTVTLLSLSKVLVNVVGRGLRRGCGGGGRT